MAITSTMLAQTSDWEFYMKCSRRVFVDVVDDANRESSGGTFRAMFGATASCCCFVSITCVADTRELVNVHHILRNAQKAHGYMFLCYLLYVF